MLETTSINRKWYRPNSGEEPKVGDWLHGFTESRWSGKNKVGRTGWVWDGEVWVQMKEGQPTGQTKENPRNTNLFGQLFENQNKSKFKIEKNVLANNQSQNDGKLTSGKTNKKGFWQQLSESFDDPADMESTGNKAVDNFFGYGANKKNLRISGLSQGAKDAQAMALARIKAGKSTLGDFGSGEDRGKLAAQYAAKNKKKLKFTKEQKKWLKENPSGTFINEDGIDQAYSPEFDLMRFNQAKKHKQWLIDHGRV
tara:strand:+ start:761 stop:1522 length:762 start_codon:yes stop_codon:yes gene_type:complete